MLLHIRIDPVWYGSEQRCQTVRPLQPGQFRRQTYTVFGSNFGANQQAVRQAFEKHLEVHLDLVDMGFDYEVSAAAAAWSIFPAAVKYSSNDAGSSAIIIS